MSVRLAVREDVDDRALSRLHALAFDAPYRLLPRRRRLIERSLTWVTAHDGHDRVVGFVNVARDGGAHAFLPDTAVDPGHRHTGLGTAVVRLAAREAAAAGCVWLHVDFEEHLRRFHLDACGFRPTAAGSLRLDGAAPPRAP